MKYTVWIEFLFLSSLLLAVSGVALFLFIYNAVLYENIISIIIVDGVCVTLIVLKIHRKIFSKPIFITRHGILVWSSPTGPTQKELESYIDYYILRLPQLWGFIKQVDIENTIKGLKLEFVPKLRKFFGIGWKAIDRYGLQKGNNIKVEYVICKLGRTELGHELHHFLEETFYELDTDNEHKNVLWWCTVLHINSEYDHR